MADLSSSWITFNLSRWSFHPFNLNQSYHKFGAGDNLNASGNTYKNVYEATAMSSGLLFVLFVNIIVSILGILFYRYIILREAGLLTADEIRLLRKYPSLRHSETYTPADAYNLTPPPMRWSGFTDFFTASEKTLSKDAQIYLFFQRACIVTTAVCAMFASVILLPCYWFGGAVFQTETNEAPNSLLSLLKSDRGLFERLTSHNLPSNSPLYMLQIPVFVVVAVCVVVLFTVIKTAAGEPRSVTDWLKDGRTSSSPAIDLSLDANNATLSTTTERTKFWTVFARGLPKSIQTSMELSQMLEALYPGQVIKVELVCKGRMSEARLLRSLTATRNRLDYLYDTTEDATNNIEHIERTLAGRIYALFAKKRTSGEMIMQLESKIHALETDLSSRNLQPAKDFLGCAFISFSSAAAVSSIIRDFPVRIEGRNVEIQEEGDDVTLGRHTRTGSGWGFPGLNNLYRGTINLLPRPMRQRIISHPTLVPSRIQEETRAHELLTGMPRPNGCLTPELVTAKLRNMKAEKAPKSGDIIWKNIGISFFERTVREMVVQVIVFTVLILFTSPVAMLTALKLMFAELALLSDPQMVFGTAGHHHNSTTGIGNIGNGSESNSLTYFNSLTSDGGNAVASMSVDLLRLLPDFLTSNAWMRQVILGYLPVLLLAMVFAGVPSVLRLTCSLEGYTTHSAKEMSVFRKTSFYYVMNAVVLPSLALNTTSEVLEILYKQSNGGANVYKALPILQRLFSGDIAFFLCNYLVQLALSGSIFWLMRVPSSCSMIIRRWVALTPLEVAEAKCTDIFDYPRHYAYSVTVMSMCLLFGFMAPLIWYFALLYFICKHAVDTFTIRYIHPRSHIDGRLPRSSANFILIWTVVSQLSLALIFYLQGWVKAGIITALLCVLTLVTCVSASMTVGNRILRLIAVLRDVAIEKLMHLLGQDMEAITAHSLLTSSSKSSSTHSLPECKESQSLLQHPKHRSLDMTTITIDTEQSIPSRVEQSFWQGSHCSDYLQLSIENDSNNHHFHSKSLYSIPEYGSCSSDSDKDNNHR